MRYGWKAADVVSGVVIRTSVSCIVIGSSGVGLRVAVLAACKNIVVVVVVLVVAAAAGGRCAAGGPGGARAVGSRVALPEILEDKAHRLSISELAKHEWNIADAGCRVVIGTSSAGRVVVRRIVVVAACKNIGFSGTAAGGAGALCAACGVGGSVVCSSLGLAAVVANGDGFCDTRVCHSHGGGDYISALARRLARLLRRGLKNVIVLRLTLHCALSFGVGEAEARERAWERAKKRKAVEMENFMSRRGGAQLLNCSESDLP